MTTTATRTPMQEAALDNLQYLEGHVTEFGIYAEFIGRPGAHRAVASAWTALQNSRTVDGGRVALCEKGLATTWPNNLDLNARERERITGARLAHGILLEVRGDVHYFNPERFRTLDDLVARREPPCGLPTLHGLRCCGCPDLT